jgi:hypothetical protein
MILDTQALLSDDQLITTTADSTNIIELPKRSSAGTPMRVWIQVTIEDFANGTSIAFDLETDALAAFGSPVDIANIAAITTANLTVGTLINIPFMPRSNEEFIRLEYTVVGTMNAGAISAGIIWDEQSNKTLYPPA